MDEIPELDDGRKLTLPVYRVIWMMFKSFEMYETELGPLKESCAKISAMHTNLDEVPVLSSSIKRSLDGV
jgi:hypothetical protein